MLSRSAGILTFAAALVAAVPAAASATQRTDLSAKAVAAGAYAHPGAALPVTLTVKRSGTKSRSAAVRAYLSADAKRSKDDVALGTARLRAMRGRTKSTAATVVGLVPASTAAGNPYVIAYVDDPSKIRERNERNNCKATKITLLAAADAAKTSQSLIEADLAAGKIDAPHALEYRVFAAMGDPRLPRQYQGDPIAAEDDGIMREVANAWPTLPFQIRQALVRNLLPPHVRPGKLKKATARSSKKTGLTDGINEDDCMPYYKPDFKWKTLRAAGNKILIHWDPATEDGAKAPEIAAALTEAYARYKTIMGREPISDGTNDCWHGEDGSLDVYIDDSLRGAAGITVPTEMRRFSHPDCDGMSSFIVARPSSPSFTTRFIFGHELFHAFENAFKEKGGCAEYHWFDEAAANWAAHSVWPDDNSEHFFEWFQESPGEPLEGYDYPDWPFVLWMQKRFGDESIRKAYVNFGTQDSVHAIDAAIGGLREHFLDLAEQAWNQDPVPTFREWDHWDVPAMDYFKPFQHPHLFLLAGQHERTAYAPAAVLQRGRQYRPFDITDERVREITFRNPKASDPDFRVGAILTLAGGGWRFEDWSGKSQVKLCRDEPEQNVTSMVLVYANSSLEKEHRIEGEPELGLRDQCDDTWHFKVLNAQLVTHTDGGRNGSSQDSICGVLAGLPIHGHESFTAQSAEPFFSTDNDLTTDAHGAIDSEIGVRVPAKFTYDEVGCTLETDPISPCSTAFDRAAGGDGQWSIGFGIDAESKKAQNATLTWWIQDPSVGFIDFGDDVCNVAEIWHPLASEQQKQTVPLAQFAGKAPFTLHFDGDTQFTEDSLGHPATLAYDWTYDITLQRVDDQGNPLG
jgi:hypothetical protein